MILEILVSSFLGLVAGIITGLFPGIHINFVAMLLLSGSGFLLQYTDPFVLVCFIISMSIAHSFFDFIPSIFLGAPNDETALSTLPGHKFLMKGKGFGAVKLALTGCYLGLLVLVIITPLFIIFLPSIYSYMQKFMALILIVASLFLILNERKKISAFFIFAVSGILGIITLNLPIKEPLFPLLTGLFGTSMLAVTISQKVKVPKQDISDLKIEKKETARVLGASVFSSSLCSFLPGLGASQAAVIASAGKKLSRKAFLVLLGSISTLVTALNFVAIYAIGKPRSGVAVAASKILENFTLQHLATFLAIVLFIGSIAFLLSVFTAKIFAKNIEKFNYSVLSWFVLLLLVFMSFIFSGWLGLIILATATSLGVIASENGIRKMHLMGCLMIPVILYYL